MAILRCKNFYFSFWSLFVSLILSRAKLLFFLMCIVDSWTCFSTFLSRVYRQFQFLNNSHSQVTHKNIWKTEIVLFCFIFWRVTIKHIFVKSKYKCCENQHYYMSWMNQILMPYLCGNNRSWNSHLLTISRNYNSQMFNWRELKALNLSLVTRETLSSRSSTTCIKE
jgi:hypothetical protein